MGATLAVRQRRTSLSQRSLGKGVDSSLKNVKQNDFNNEVAGSGCGEVKHDFKIDDILDGFLSAR
jgi:hypothetical protein